MAVEDLRQRLEVLETEHTAPEDDYRRRKAELEAGIAAAERQAEHDAYHRRRSAAEVGGRQRFVQNPS